MSLDELPDFENCGEENSKNSVDDTQENQQKPCMRLTEILSQNTLYLIFGSRGYFCDDERIEQKKIKADKPLKLFSTCKHDAYFGKYRKTIFDRDGQLVSDQSTDEQPSDEGEYSFYTGKLPEDHKLNFIIGIRQYPKNKSAQFRGELFFRTFYGDDWDIQPVQTLFEELRKTIDKQYRITKKKLDRAVYQAANEAIMKLRRPESTHIEDIADIPLEKINPEYLKQENNGNGFRYHRYSLEQAKEIIRLVCLPIQIERENARMSTALSDEQKKARLEEILRPSQAAIELLYFAYASIPQGKYYLTKYTKADGEVIEISRKKFSGFVTNDLKFRYVPPGHIEICMPDWTVALHIIQNDYAFAEHPTRMTLDCRPHSFFALWNDKPDYKEMDEDELRKQLEEIWKQQAKKAGKKIRITATRENIIDLNFIPDADEFDNTHELFEFITSFLDYRAPGKPYR